MVALENLPSTSAGQAVLSDNEQTDHQTAGQA